MKRAIITGSFGFIGKNLYEEAKKYFDKVESIEETILSFEDWKQRIHDILETQNPDVIFHVGACSNTLETDVNYMMTRNYESTKVLTDWCVKNNKQIIYSSSAASYGVGDYPSNLYGWSKYAAEDYVIGHGGVALRYFNVYGPGEEHKGVMASVAHQMSVKHLDNVPIKLFPGNPTRDFVYVKDIVSANLFAYDNFSNLQGKYYDVGFGESESFEYILKILGIPYEYTSSDIIPKGYQFYTCSNKDKWMSEWKPKYSLKEGLLEYKKYMYEYFSTGK